MYYLIVTVVVFIMCLNIFLVSEEKTTKSDDENLKTIEPTTAEEWEVDRGEIKEIEYKNKKGIVLKSTGKITIAKLKDVNFKNGIIEFDVAASGKGEFFIGAAFRIQNEFAKNFKIKDNVSQKIEFIYFRPFRSKTANAIQYCAGGTKFNWEYSRKNHPGEFEGKAVLPETDWFHVKIIVKDKVAKVFVNDAKTPNLVINNLKHGISEGGVGLYSFWKTAYFANIKITKN